MKTEEKKVTEATEAAEATEATEKKKKILDLNEEVKVHLHKDDGKYKDDLVVILNGTAIKVPRGKEVKIKRKYALVIEEALKARGEALTKAEALQK